MNRDSPYGSRPPSANQPPVEVNGEFFYQNPDERDVQEVVLSREPGRYPPGHEAPMRHPVAAQQVMLYQQPLPMLPQQDYMAPPMIHQQFMQPQMMPQQQFNAPPMMQRPGSAPPMNQQQQFCAPPMNLQQFMQPPMVPQQQFNAPPMMQRPGSAPPMSQYQQLSISSNLPDTKMNEDSSSCNQSPNANQPPVEVNGEFFYQNPDGRDVQEVVMSREPGRYPPGHEAPMRHPEAAQQVMIPQQPLPMLPQQDYMAPPMNQQQFMYPQMMPQQNFTAPQMVQQQGFMGPMMPQPSIIVTGQEPWRISAPPQPSMMNPPLNMAKPRPVLSEMPWLVKQKVIGHTDNISRLVLRKTNTEFRQLVDHSPHPTHYKLIKLTVEKRRVVLEFEYGYNQVFQVEYRQANFSNRIKWHPRHRVVIGNFDHIQKAVLELATIFAHRKASVDVFRLMASEYVKNSVKRSLKTFPKDKASFLNAFQETFSQFPNQAKIAILDIQWVLNEAEMMQIIPYVKPNNLETLEDDSIQ